MFSRVVFLYLIDSGEQKYFYTNASRDILYDDNLYLAVPIRHDTLENDADEVTKGKCDITVSNQTDYVQRLLQQSCQARGKSTNGSVRHLPVRFHTP